MLRLYDFHDSGNGYKVRLLLAMLGIAFASAAAERAGNTITMGLYQ